jgi:hypothetical protein
LKLGETMNKHTPIEHSRLKIVPAFLILGALLLIASACSTAASSSPVATSAAAAQPTSMPLSAATSIPQAAATTAPASRRDVNSMNPCALFPGDALASAIGTTLTDPTNPGAGLGTQCTYSFGPSGAGDGTTLLYNLFLMPPELYTPSLNGMMNSQPVSGMGDMASMGTRTGTTINDLMVLKTGDIAIEVNGADPVILQKIAAYVLAHLP